jgi:hypothetical protein
MSARDGGMTARHTGMTACDTAACGRVAGMSAAGTTHTAAGESVDCRATVPERDGPDQDDGSVQLDISHDLCLSLCWLQLPSMFGSW